MTFEGRSRRFVFLFNNWIIKVLKKDMWVLSYANVWFKFKIFIKYYFLIIKQRWQEKIKETFDIYHTILNFYKYYIRIKNDVAKKQLDLLCFEFPEGKGCSMHLFVKKKLLTMDKMQELPTNGILTPPPPPNPPVFFFFFFFFFVSPPFSPRAGPEIPIFFKILI